MMLKDGTEDGTGEVEDGTAKTGVVKNQDGRCLVEFCFDQSSAPAVTFALPHNSLPVAGARQNCASIIFCFSITSATIMLSS